MTAPILDLDLPPEHPLRQILDFIAAHPEVRQPVLRALLTEDFLSLPVQVQELRTDLSEFKQETREQFQQVNARIDENTRRIDENTRRLDENTRRLDENTWRLDENTRRLDENTRRLDENIRLTRSIQGSVGALRGDSYEDLCREEIEAILDGWLERAVLADRNRINNRLGELRHGNLISRQDFLEGLRPDIIARAKNDTEESRLLAVVEVSITFNRGDLETAARRARIISDATGVPANAYVVTNHPWPNDVAQSAQQLGVTIIRHEAPQYADL